MDRICFPFVDEQIAVTYSVRAGIHNTLSNIPKKSVVLLNVFKFGIYNIYLHDVNKIRISPNTDILYFFASLYVKKKST